jgi:7-cyano-7-deazaguanine synthase
MFMSLSSPPNAAIVLLSGGLDSTVALAEILTSRPVTCALTFDYGQRAVKKELAATQALAVHYQVPHKIIPLPWVADLLPQALQQQKGDAQASLSEEELFDVHRVWVPNRNGLFLNIAACFAEALNVQTIAFGANAEEGASFPDNTPEFRDCLTQALAYSTLNGVRVETPVGHLQKTEIIQRGLELDVPFHLIWSCYEGLSQQCGACPSCLRVKAARDQVATQHGKTAAIQFETR